MNFIQDKLFLKNHRLIYLQYITHTKTYPLIVYSLTYIIQHSVEVGADFSIFYYMCMYIKKRAETSIVIHRAP